MFSAVEMDKKDILAIEENYARPIRGGFQ